VKVVWLSELRTRLARLLGWTALLAAVCSVSLEPLFGGKGIGRWFGIGAWLSLVTLVLAVSAAVLNWRAVRPRSRVPVIALVIAVLLVVAYAYIVIMLAGLANMH